MNRKESENTPIEIKQKTNAVELNEREYEKKKNKNKTRKPVCLNE